ncbi:dihydroorotase [Holzapfeliella sp. JNUCC 72]
MTKSTLIKNVILDGTSTAILIEDGIIKQLAPIIEEKAEMTVIDGQQNTVLPGLIDVHVHFREPGLTYKETIETGTKAAAHGGFTTVFAMPNVKPVVDNPKSLQHMFDLNERDSVVKTLQYAAISSNLSALDNTDISKMAEMGAIGFTNDGCGVQQANIMYEAMLKAKEVQKPIIAHVEDNSLTNKGVMNEGESSRKLNLPGINSLSESSQLARDLVLAHHTGVHYHVAHISTKESVELVRIAKQMGVHVTAEVSPHHLLLDDSMVENDNPMMKMNPPLRSKADRKALIAGLIDGTIDMIATDHAPHSEEEKQDSMLEAAFGIVGIETSFSLIYTKFVKSGLVDLNTLINWMSKNPAKAFNISGGRLAVGQPADLTIMDLDKQYEIQAKDFLSKGTNTPFLGWQVFGQTKYTVVDGKVVYKG